MLQPHAQAPRDSLSSTAEPPTELDWLIVELWLQSKMCHSFWEAFQAYIIQQAQLGSKGQRKELKSWLLVRSDTNLSSNRQAETAE